VLGSRCRQACRKDNGNFKNSVGQQLKTDKEEIEKKETFFLDTHTTP